MLTLIIIPTGVSCHDTVESFTGIMTKLELLECGQSFDVPVDTKWKMYMYAGEFLDKDLEEAIPAFLEKGADYDCFQVYKSSPTGFSISPRLFKDNIKIQGNSLMPVRTDLKITTILDGFILER